MIKRIFSMLVLMSSTPAISQDYYKFLACRLSISKCAIIDREIAEERRYAIRQMQTGAVSAPSEAQILAHRYGVARASRLSADVQSEIARIRNCQAKIDLSVISPSSTINWSLCTK